MNRVINLLLRVGLVVSVLGVIGQAVLMALDVFILPELRWYWGGALAYFAAPVAFAFTLHLVERCPIAEGK